MIYAKVSDSTKDQLIALAGGQRKVGAYLDRIVPMLIEAQTELDAALEEAQRDVLTAALAKQQAQRGRA
jgi:hypothetical protein